MRNHPSKLQRALCFVVLYAFATASLSAQATGRLTLDVREGGSLAHAPGTPAGATVAVRVTDERGQPVQGAVVVFQLPMSGAGATFPDDTRFSTVFSAESGIARSPELRPNSIAGEFDIVVTASFRDAESATVTLKHSIEGTARNAGPAGRSKGGGGGKIIAIIAVIGGAAAGAALGLSGGGGGGTPAPGGPPINPGSPPTGITPGSPTIGAP